MKQNTKFLWLYIGILFSFALILIIFAGLSRNSDIEQKEGLQGHVTKLSEQVLDLTNKINTQNATIETQNGQIVSLTSALQKINETALVQARDALDKGNREACNKILESITADTLTESQLVMYETLAEKE